MSVVWGGKGDGRTVGFMELLWWALVAYEGLVGIAEFSSSNATLATVSTWPSVGSLIQGTATPSSNMPAIIDLATAAGIYYFAIHRR